ncbi:hypothetical protein E2C01_029566 [Portunus trituberculatus]|uniref:Uncharacterized protein n=1 Tax=Portunus trituberculatus TaxID=210409 RepID=A0A5B7ES87_PORTR|nr:hypothetical protein [Portunus trituberculatus]
MLNIRLTCRTHTHCVWRVLYLKPPELVAVSQVSGFARSLLGEVLQRGLPTLKKEVGQVVRGGYESLAMRAGKSRGGQGCESWKSTPGPGGIVAPRRATLSAGEEVSNSQHRMNASPGDLRPKGVRGNTYACLLPDLDSDVPEQSGGERKGRSSAIVTALSLEICALGLFISLDYLLSSRCQHKLNFCPPTIAS